MHLLSTLVLIELASASVHYVGGFPGAFLAAREASGLVERQDKCAGNQGATNCQEYCGPDWEMCAVDNYCYNPKIHICCSNGWHCDQDQYCIDGNRCCPNGDTLEQCDATSSVSTIGGGAAPTAPPSEETTGTPIVTTPVVTTPAVVPTSAAPPVPVPGANTTVITPNPPAVTAGAVEQNAQQGILVAAGGIAALFMVL